MKRPSYILEEQDPFDRVLNDSSRDTYPWLQVIKRKPSERPSGRSGDPNVMESTMAPKTRATLRFFPIVKIFLVMIP